MNPSPNVTMLLEQVSTGRAAASEELLPLVYEELRRLAQASLSRERAGLTLQPTALVHEAYMRLVGDGDVAWRSRGHFFGAAAQAMRRILIERARHYARVKHGGGRGRVELNEEVMTNEPQADTMLAIDEVLDRLAAYDARKAQIVLLRFFAGLTLEQTASALELSLHDVRTEWAYARAWMHRELVRRGDDPGAADAAPTE
jgi:RNA polymerase sigma factor (TIGR02999 family)